MSLQKITLATIIASWWLMGSWVCAQEVSDPRVTQLAEEVHNKGWIVFAARGDNGTWDLFLMRPDGSQRRNITNTPD